VNRKNKEVDEKIKKSVVKIKSQSWK